MGGTKYLSGGRCYIKYPSPPPPPTHTDPPHDIAQAQELRKVLELKLKLKQNVANAEKAATDAAAQMLTVTQALATSHNHVRVLTAETSGPQDMMQIMCIPSSKVGPAL